MDIFGSYCCPMIADFVDPEYSRFNLDPLQDSKRLDHKQALKHGGSATPSTAHEITIRSRRGQSMSRPKPNVRHRFQRKHSLAPEDLRKSTILHMQSIDDGPANLQQMFSSFIWHHFPTARAQDFLVRRRSYLLTVPTIDLSEDALIQQAVSVVCFAHIGTTKNDARLVHESRHRYGEVLSMLGRELQTSAPKHQAMAVVLSILLVSLYDDALPGAQALQANWTAHYEGAQAYLATAGPSSLDMKKPMDSSLLLNMREPALWIGLAKRRSTVLSQPVWVDLAEQTPSVRSGPVTLRRLTFQVPGFLERTENSLTGILEEGSFAQLCSEIINLQTALQRWFRETRQREHLSDLESHLIHLTDHDAFDASIEEQLVMTTNTTFLSFFKLDDFGVTDDVVKYHLFSLVLDCTLLRLFHHRPEMAVRNGCDIRPEAHRDAYQKACGLCRTLHSLSVLADDSLAMIAYMEIAVRLAENYFEQINLTRERGWCQAVRLAIDLRRTRVAATRPPTLCRLDQLIEPIATLANFTANPVLTTSYQWAQSPEE